MSYIGPHKVFQHLDRLTGWQAGARPAPVTVEIDLSNACSLKCAGCHFAHAHVAGPWAVADRPKPDGYTETGKFADVDLLDRAFGQMAKAGVKALVFSGGGEPTLHPSFDAVALAARLSGLQLGMYTLGGHLSATPSRASLVRETFSFVVISLDCVDGDQYSREKGVPASRFVAACDGVRAVAGGPATVGVSFLLHAGNWTHAGRMLALARDLGASYATFRPMVETDPVHLSQIGGDRSWVTAALPTLQALQQHDDVEIDPDRFVEFRDWASHGYPTCYGIRLVTQITPDGRVWICPNRRGIAGSELGDLTRESFAEIWARHPGQVTDFTDCRAMCRLHLVNRTLDHVYAPSAHANFV